MIRTAMTHWARILVLICSISEAGWMALDGSRALVVGDYITPTSGPHAGELGPWRFLVERVGLDPRGTPMKAIFATYGFVWLGIAARSLRGGSWGAMLIAAAGALWYLPFGTLFSVVQIVLLTMCRTAWRG